MVATVSRIRHTPISRVIDMLIRNRLLETRMHHPREMYHHATEPAPRIETTIYLGTEGHGTIYDQQQIMTWCHEQRELSKGATITPGIGTYEGTQEQTVVVTVIHGGERQADLDLFALKAAQKWQQASVWVTQQHLLFTEVTTT